MADIGRNDPCPCGSGKKYKTCCLVPRKVSEPIGVGWRRMLRTEEELVTPLLIHMREYYGPDPMFEGWDEFSGWNDVVPDREAEPELDTMFRDWLLYNWIPDNTERNKAEHLPEMPMAMHYLEKRRSRLDSYKCRFIEAACARNFSFFQVTRVVPGKELDLRDILLRQDVTVSDTELSTIAEPGEIVFARVVTLDDDSVILGLAPVMIPASYSGGLIDFRERILEVLPDIGRELPHEYDIELRAIYYDIRNQLRNPDPTGFQNTDGEPLQPTELHYKLKCTVREALDALLTLSQLKDASPFLEWGEFDESGDLVAIEFPWAKKAKGRTSGGQLMVLGRIALRGDDLSIEVNSQERADAIQRKVKYRLGKRVELRSTVIQSVEDAMEKASVNPPKGPMAGLGMPGEDPRNTPEVQAKIREMARQHWQSWPDMPLQVLKGQTPREAVKTAVGRERLRALLLDFENRVGQNDPGRPFVLALRRELGLEPES